jgi:hypothetical protein
MAGCQAAVRRYIAPSADKVRRVVRGLWRDGRVAEGARLESVYTGNRIVGSNPTLSASFTRCSKSTRRGVQSESIGLVLPIPKADGRAGPGWYFRAQNSSYPDSP